MNRIAIVSPTWARIGDVEPGIREARDADQHQQCAQDEGRLTGCRGDRGAVDHSLTRLRHDDRRDDVEDDHRDDAAEQPDHEDGQPDGGGIRAVVLGDPTADSREHPVGSGAIQAARRSALGLGRGWCGRRRFCGHLAPPCASDGLAPSFVPCSRPANPATSAAIPMATMTIGHQVPRSTGARPVAKTVSKNQ